MIKIKLSLITFSLLATNLLLAEDYKIPGITISDSAVAIPDPISTYSAPISVLNYDPRVDLQERAFAEGQADIAIRGGTFEGTGLRLGSVGIVDPQTGHYLAELPLSPLMLNQPDILTGVDNSIYGFNATAGTINYGLKTIQDDINARVAIGTHNLNLQQTYIAKQNILQNGTGSLNLDLDAARSEMGGTRAGGSNDLERFSGRLQWIDSRSQTDLLFGYQDKKLSWPNLYVLPELHNLVGGSNVESEHLETALALFNHHLEYNDDDYFEITSYYRENKDDYEFDVSNPGLFNAYRHNTEVWGSGFSGKHGLDFFDLKYTGQYIFDDINSTSLTFNDFNSRSYGKFAITPEKTFEITPDDKLIATTGTAYDYSDRDNSQFSPIARLAWDFDNNFSKDQSTYLEYAKSSKVPGYTALGSSPTSGLFKGNKELGRENSQNVELGYDLKNQSIQTHLATFYRHDSNLVDWTYDSSSQPFATRTATNVDIDVYGFETFISKDWDSFSGVLGYAFIKKHEDYDQEDIDASFYALNYPNHRVTTALSYQATEDLSLRIDNEYRLQEDNSLRNSADQAFFTTLSSSWNLPGHEQLSIYLAIDNLWKVYFEDVPGVPGRGRLYSIGLNYKLN